MSEKIPLKVIEGKYGLIRIFRAERQATREDYEEFVRFLAGALMRQELRNMNRRVK